MGKRAAGRPWPERAKDRGAPGANERPHSGRRMRLGRAARLPAVPAFGKKANRSGPVQVCSALLRGGVVWSPRCLLGGERDGNGTLRHCAVAAPPPCLAGSGPSEGQRALCGGKAWPNSAHRTERRTAEPNKRPALPSNVLNFRLPPRVLVPCLQKKNEPCAAASQ